MPTPTASTLNTVMLVVTLGVLAFIGNSAVETGKAQARIIQSQVDINQRLSDLRKDYQDLSIRIMALEVEMARRRQL